MGSFEKKLITIGGILAVLLVMLLLMVTKISPGYAGVVYNMNGGIEEGTLGQGWKIVAPWKKVIEYPVSLETAYLSADVKEGSKDDDSFYINSKDGKQVNVDVQYSYMMDVEMLPHIFTKFRGQNDDFIEDTYIRARIKEVTNVISTQYEVLDIYGAKRDELNIKTREALISILGQEGILLENFSFTRIEPDTETKKAIQDRVNARQKLEQARTEQERAIIEAETRKEQARIAAEEKVLKAQGDADAILIEAAGQAEANKIVAASLTSSLVEYTKVNKWNGELPTVSGSNALISLGVE